MYGGCVSQIRILNIKSNLDYSIDYPNSRCNVIDRQRDACIHTENDYRNPHACAEG